MNDESQTPPSGVAAEPPTSDAQDSFSWATYAPPPPRQRFQHRYTKHVVLLVLTFITTTFAGVLGGEFPSVLFAVLAWPFAHWDIVTFGGQLLRALPTGLYYSLPVLLILGAHEFGHYLYCRVYNVDATLPYFLPAPILSGTLGAVIRIKEPFPSKQALFDIGIGGPIAGFIVLVPFLLIGVAMSSLGRVDPNTETIYFGEPLLIKAAIWLRFGVRPEGFDVMLHPMGLAAWWGMLATALNLLPYGQLDGGHIAYAVLGNRAKWVSIVTLGVVWLMVSISISWLVTAILLSVMTALFGFRHPLPIDDETPVSRGRVMLAIVAAIIFIVCFTPVPVDLIGPAAK